MQGAVFPSRKQSILVSSPLHFCLKHAQDILFLALGDVRHPAELPVVVVIPVLRMLLLYKLCREKTPEKGPVGLDRSQFRWALSFFHTRRAGQISHIFQICTKMGKWTLMGRLVCTVLGKTATNGNVSP